MHNTSLLPLQFAAGWAAALLPLKHALLRQHNESWHRLDYNYPTAPSISVQLHSSQRPGAIFVSWTESTPPRKFILGTSAVEIGRSSTKLDKQRTRTGEDDSVSLFTVLCTGLYGLPQNFGADPIRLQSQIACQELFFLPNAGLKCD